MDQQAGGRTDDPRVSTASPGAGHPPSFLVGVRHRITAGEARVVMGNLAAASDHLLPWVYLAAAYPRSRRYGSLRRHCVSRIVYPHRCAWEHLTGPLDLLAVFHPEEAPGHTAPLAAVWGAVLLRGALRAWNRRMLHRHFVTDYATERGDYPQSPVTSEFVQQVHDALEADPRLAPHRAELVGDTGTGGWLAECVPQVARGKDSTWLDCMLRRSAGYLQAAAMEEARLLICGCHDARSALRRCVDGPAGAPWDRVLASPDNVAFVKRHLMERLFVHPGYTKQVMEPNGRDWSTECRPDPLVSRWRERDPETGGSASFVADMLDRELETLRQAAAGSRGAAEMRSWRSRLDAGDPRRLRGRG